jgi:hypothetical protein
MQLTAVAGMPQVLTAIEYSRGEARQDLESPHKVRFNLPGCAGFTNQAILRGFWQ